MYKKLTVSKEARVQNPLHSNFLITMLIELTLISVICINNIHIVPISKYFVNNISKYLIEMLFLGV